LLVDFNDAPGRVLPNEHREASGYERADQVRGDPGLETAIKDLRKVKAQGRTAWIEDTAGRFVSVQGVRRKPKRYDQHRGP
jgi:hypothetical protein